MSEATIIAKILWYTGNLSLQRLAWFLEISEDKVLNIIDSDAYLDAIVALIRTRPDRSGVSIEDWWVNEWKNTPQRFSKRMKIPEAKISELISRAQQGNGLQSKLRKSCKFLCILFAIAVILCGCTTHPQRITFQEQYNIYADPVVDYSNMVIAIPGAEPYPAMAFEQCGLDLDTLQDFIDAIVRRMDARNLVQYQAIQNEVDELYRKLCNTLDMNDTKTLYTWPEGYAYRVLSGYYKTRDEYGLKAAFATVQYLKYQLKH